MKLIDDVTIIVKAGDGGPGGVATKQVYGSKKTVPDGGNGGNGGSIFFRGNANVSDLSEFTYKKKIIAPNGVPGGNKDLDGANGEDVYVDVPFGTTITDVDSGQYVEILTEEPFCVAYGGIGGIGNHDYNPFATTGQRKQKGTIAKRRVAEPGEERTLHLVLNLIADIGLVGLPNAGKSSLLQTLTNATPKVGNYPFTTLSPNLGVMGKVVIADIPGLIEGASTGKGLGIQFLKHIKKTKVLLHCIDASDPEIEKTYKTVRDEFKNFDESLLKKQEIIVLTKTDLASENMLKKNKAIFRDNANVIEVSIYNTESIDALRRTITSFFET